MRLLVTRPENDGKTTAAKLRLMGHEAVLEPLLDIKFLDSPEINSNSVQALIATSANGIRALTAHKTAEKFKSIPLLTIGEASAEAARQSGFKQVLIGGGTLPALAQDVPKHFRPENGKILYLAGRARSGDLVRLLAEQGFSAELIVLYEAVRSTRFSQTTNKLIRENKLDGVLHFSVRSAGIYLDMIHAENLESQSASCVHYCLSQQIADLFVADNYHADRIRVAEEATHDSLLACIEGDTNKSANSAK